MTGRIGALLDPWSRYANPQAPLPVYFPDEALLIKAEALANQNQLAPSQAALDSVRTDCTGGRGIDDPKACLPALAGQLRRASCSTEIYVQRRYELFGTGLAVGGRSSSNGHSWTRPRRPHVPDDGQRCWLPYAVGDRNANPNATFAALPDPTEPAAFPASCPRSEADEHDEESPNYRRARCWSWRRRRAEPRTRRVRSRRLARRDASGS